MSNKRGMTAAQKARQKIFTTVLTWSHVMAMSVLILAALSNISGLAAILFKPEVAEAVCEYVRAWQTFFTAGILGYDAKSTIENTMKIMKSVKETRQLDEEQDTQNG